MPNVRFGSKADMYSAKADVCFTPESGLQLADRTRAPARSGGIDPAKAKRVHRALLDRVGIAFSRRYNVDYRLSDQFGYWILAIGYAG